MTTSDEARKLFDERLMPKIAEALDRRASEESKLERLTAALVEAESEVSRLTAALSEAEGKAAEQVSLGGDVRSSFKSSNKIRDELQDQTAWREQLTERLLPAAKQAVKQARADALACAVEALGPVREVWSVRLQQVTDEFVQLTREWESAGREFFQGNRLNVEPLSMGNAPRISIDGADRALLRLFFQS